MTHQTNPPTREGYIAYFASKIGSERQPTPTFALDEAMLAARELTGQYDLGIALAADGLATGYVFNYYGLPVKAVKLTREGTEATWQPIDEITSGDIRDKKLILFEWDVVTGTTLKRVVHELGKSYPKHLDLLLVCGKTLVTWGNFEKIGHLIKGNCELDRHGRGFWYDCESNVPEGIRKVTTLIPNNHRH